jgi:hypothetical protein
MNLRHLEWLIGERVPDPAMVVYEVRPYAPAQANRIIEQLCALAGLEVGQTDEDPAAAVRVRQAFGLIVNAARVRQEMLNLEQFEHGIGRPPWRDLLKDLRHDRRQFGATIGDKSARSALRWALGDLGLATRAGRRWLHHLRDNPVVRRRTIDRALKARLLQRDAGRSDRHDRVVLVQGVGRAYQLLTDRRLGRSLTAEQRPSGPGLRLVRLCLVPLDPLVTDDAIVWAIRCGLLMAILAARAFRRGNLAQMRVGKHITKIDGVYVCTFTAAETKNGRELVEPLPVTLTRYIDRYLDEVRPALLRGHASDAFWVSTYRAALSEQSIYTKICAATEEELGVRARPWAFIGSLPDQRSWPSSL